MKFHFEDDLDYQLAAIESVCDLFRGQEICRTEFTVKPDLSDKQMRLQYAKDDLGIGNRLTLLDDELLENLHDIQLRNGVRPSVELTSGDFTVEMETGTGKTYVYLRTIFELNRRYGFTKFVIVVPSVAIKEGVNKSIEMMAEHFRLLYSGEPFEWFQYDGSKPGAVRNFATSPQIQIMVVTVGAINKKDVNNLYKDSEKTGGYKPIELICDTRPIVIVDEPQSVDGGLTGKGKDALESMNPMCTLRYSATHVDKHHMVYRLDAVDAYEQKLVKQIEIASAGVEGGFNKPYVKLLSVNSTRGVITAKIETDIQKGDKVHRKTLTVHDSDDLEQATGRAIYENFRIGEISTKKGSQFMELRYPGGEMSLKVGEAYGDVEPMALQREMIRRTIKEHLDKEIRLAPHGIKVLSLFFIDAVEHYRKYDDDGTPIKGVYAEIFEEEYRRFARHPDYQTLFKEVDITTAAENVHNGYFSRDKKGKSVDTNESNQTGRDNAQRAYKLIMRKKEELLSFDTPLKFIFSHSALKEGWDNPNVFQICALREIGTERERRQTLGRGLRLCVNQNGERLRGFDVNTLTVIATESYEQYAENLQKEIEKDTGIRFGIVEEHQFAGVRVADDQGNVTPLGFDQSKILWQYLKSEGFINTKGKIQDTLRTALKDETLVLPEEFRGQHVQVRDILAKLAGRLEVKDADARKTIRPRRAVLDGPEFKELWDRIKHKTTYRVQFDNEDLIKTCIKAIDHAPPIGKTRLQWRKADLAIGRAGVAATETAQSAPVVLDESDIDWPDLITDLQDRTQLTRRTIVRVLRDSERLDDFKRNPQQFIELAGEAINKAKRLAITDGIRYQRLGDDVYYAQELFEQEELTGYLKNMVESKKGVYEYVVYDSGTEKDFAQQLDTNEAVKVYAKLPGWFKVPTPLETYNPDWAVLVEKDGAERLYFVVETKSDLFEDAVREKENAKIKCGTAHFKALSVGESQVLYKRAAKVNDLFTS
ncbi:type III restriction-modification system endonuclease [Rosistilla oblonga]|uniref:type III restriction-modification system endonuclease n=1 Tax=Rosistilla oblonga TaxID=2527990 RepID=UPI003A9849FE